MKTYKVKTAYSGSILAKAASKKEAELVVKRILDQTGADDYIVSVRLVKGD